MAYVICMNSPTRRNGVKNWYTVSTGTTEISYSAGVEIRSASELWDYCESESIRKGSSFLDDIVYEGNSYEKASEAFKSLDVYVDSYPSNDTAIVKYALLDECVIDEDGEPDYSSIVELRAKIDLV